ncbi:hypothetical protein UFOVP684_39 [uncultured Caudovirales phage]|jgi:hypothetical protein|uniref:Uncharacterized protein n=1 Tax=uncultured Caudovirales phage TaxID=2100421 RepID=A0A6J5MAE9_9CAUD|nr:hypothetical protein UFOVP409_63 [uncultured Caudovirales phage]CAB4157683.1 hypothetical protein UFOVP684_39 [uncultured Caudovirales phage]
MENLRTQTVHSDGDGGIIIETKQDISDILDRNKMLQEADKARLGATEDLHLIGSIPFTAIDKLNEMGIMRGFFIVDETAFKKWLNHPDQAPLKIYRGTV